MVDPIVQAIINRRKSAGLSRVDIANIAGMSLKTYQRIERGESDMKISQYRSIIRAMKMTDLDIALDIRDTQQVTAEDVTAASRLLNQEAQAMLVKFLFLVANKDK
ncbi:helix-turn-helix domain-containing protein [Vibrio sp. LaRot3]|uniref:helix-turn-helix domain-containing protein n=1 Tax=Vibrio sp. LaRot3 TaxID=2998829 RepID=UPI0022CE097E|nr:helix-turn-helix transcriptional regulator [Vibrio sp. LaRot3]MDA0148985.1 helix-turn-helix transcriptional regulator [Vibrio sp. LaRot3]